MAQSFYPYGEDRGTVEPNDELKFATYTRDAASGLDYADQRYYASNFGRFMSADRYKASARAKDPRSWNRYAYTRGDPVNRFDPSGRYDCDPEDDDCDPCPPTEEAQEVGDPGDPDDPCGGGGGGGGGADNPQLTCQFGGATIFAPGWGDVPKTGSGYHMPIYLNFYASGGSGSYNWRGVQNVVESGQIDYGSGVFFNLANIPPFTEPPYYNQASPPTGPSAEFFDAPGLASTSLLYGTVAFAEITWQFTFNATVSSGGATVNCPTVSWSATLIWVDTSSTPCSESDPACLVFGWDTVYTFPGQTSSSQ